MDKGFWMPKGGGQVPNVDPIFDNSSRMEPKRARGWFLDDSEPQLFPSKKQAIEASICKPETGIEMSNPLSWENSSGFQSMPNQFIDRLFGSEPIRPNNLAERNMAFVGTDGSNSVNDSSVDLSRSHVVEDPEAGVNYGGIRKVKVNQVKDPENVVFMDPAYSRISESNFMLMGEPYGKEGGNVTLDPTYDNACANIRTSGSNNIFFGGYQGESIIDDLSRPVSSYNLLYEQPPAQMSEITPSKKEVDVVNENSIGISSQAPKSLTDSTSKNKSVTKSAKKEAPNSFPSNVRSLLTTGMLDGVPVRYVSVTREELRGIIKGAGYLCGCQSCNYSKALNAYEFERHASCKTKHPNNHIYFENGKTIYQIVQELRSTPENVLFDVVQTVTGSPINQKAFRFWKESFQAATRELQRIYGKEELNL